jgi:competence protein ComEA
MQPKNKNTLRAYFTFTARERRAIYLLLFLTAVFFLLPRLIPNILKPVPEIINDEVLLPERKSIQTSTRNHLRNNPELFIAEHEKTQARLFHFDPNTTSFQQWQQLGVKDKTAQTILKYVQKGGRFRVPEDLKKIWGLTPIQAERLIPFVVIKDDADNQRFSQRRKDSIVKKTSFDKHSIDVNVATQEQWESLKGIGSGLASRIIKFREKLGGFISIDQVKETYGLPDSTFQQIRSKLIYNEISVTRLNINELNLEQLAIHPYIRYKVARAIINYREQHGWYQSVRELEKIESIAPETLHKMEKYLTVN